MNIKIVRLKDLVNISPQGKMNLLKFKEYINELSSVKGLFIDYDLLIDTRGAETQMGVFEVWELAKELATVIQTGSHKGFRAKIAVICPVKDFDNAKFFELCSLNHGLNVHAFNSFEDLYEWISIPQTLDRDKSL